MDGLRIAMVTETYPPEVNGVARTVSEMVEGLRLRGHSIQLVRPRQNGADRAFLDGNLEEVLGRGIAIPRYPQLKLGLPARRALRRQWSLRRPDVVHIATEGPLGWSALAAARDLDLPAATDFHTNFHTYSRHYGMGWLARPVVAYLRRFHNRADCTLVPTAELAEGLTRDGFERLRVVGRGVNPAVFSPQRRSAALRARWGAAEDTPVALCVSRFAPEKNFPLVIKAFEAMRQARPDAKLVLVGDGPMSELLRRRNVGYVVAGRLVNGELSAHYASADLFLFPSTSETFGNVTLEAMASGLGIVAYRYAAAREHLRNEESALLATPDDEAAFIAAAERLVREPGLAGRLGQAARATAERLTWQRIVEDFEAVLFNVAA
ncbi:MAG TPA: glycosyltransferase family 1 protein [Candidatus Dormibacteraeota bacterium]|nr:glycosyltransferase family 1 protein [Candidatus Dormibacteraeota bacterium]